MYRFKTGLLFLLIVGLGACDLLENQQPQQSLPVEGGLDSVEELQSALTGAYEGLQELPDGDSFAQALFASDIMAEDAFWTGSFPTYQAIAAQEMSAPNASIENQWNGAYEAINSANIILSSLDELESSDSNQAAIDNIRGEALFIRAIEYYYQVQYFAQPWGFTPDNSHPGVPLQLQPVISSDDFQNPARSSVDSVYIQIISDLEEAQGLLTTSTRNRATAEAATAFLARIALIQGRWEDAANLSDQIISNGDYSLASDVTTYFQSELSSESIFEIENTVQDNPGASNTSMTAVYNADSRDDIQISEAFRSDLNSIINDRQQSALDAAGATATDTRLSLLLTGTVIPAEVDQPTAASNSLKYESIPNEEDNLPILRLSEMILTRAEALAELNGVNQESIDLLNQIRTRAFNVSSGNEELIEYTTADFSSQQDLINAILLERQVELAFEGHRLFDLQRRQLDVRGTAWNAPNLVFPIPQSQIDANENICQNAGYGDPSERCQ